MVLAPRIPGVLVAFGIVCFAVLHLAAVGPYWEITPDSTVYMEGARAIAEGRPYEIPLRPPATSLAFSAALTAVEGFTAYCVFGVQYMLVARTETHSSPFPESAIKYATNYDLQRSVVWAGRDSREDEVLLTQEFSPDPTDSQTMDVLKSLGYIQ